MKKYTAKEIVNGLFNDPIFLKSMALALVITLWIVGLIILGNL